MKTVNGIIKAVKSSPYNQNKIRLSYLLTDDNWYNVIANNNLNFSKGDTVEITYDMNGNFRNIKTIKKTENKINTNTTNNNQVMIIKQNALGHATNLVLSCLTEEQKQAENIDSISAKIIEVAERFKEYVIQDGDTS